MCSQKAKQHIHNSNRLIIAALSIMGFLSDGVSPTDLLFSLSIILWLWQPEWDQWEEVIIDKFAPASWAGAKKHQQ